MTTDESSLPSEWHAIAARELAAARLLFNERDEFLAISGMLLQQAVEKYLKGALLARGWMLVRIHDLGQLLKALVAYEPAYAEFADACLRITDFYLENRYPLRPSSPVNRDELAKLFEQAESLIQRIRATGSDRPPPAAS